MDYKNMITEISEQRKQWAQKDTVGKRIQVDRDGKDPVDTIIYRPKNHEENKLYPVIYHMHGGAWIGADAILLESFCRLLADKLPAFVVNINYKKADEHPLPYPHQEVVDTVKHFINNRTEYGIDVERMVVCGHSAGAQIAAGATLMLKDEGINLSCQVLVYPVTDMGDEGGDLVKNLRPILFPEGGWDSHYMSPVNSTEKELENVAPAVFILCGTDDFRSHGITYAKRLIDAGVSVKVKEYKNAEHGFLEVNRPDYVQGDSRQNPEQEEYARDCERFLIREIRAILAIAVGDVSE